MSTIDEIMEMTRDVADAMAALLQHPSGMREIILKKEVDGLRTLIAAALADAERKGAERMRGAAAGLCKQKADREGDKAMEAEEDEPGMLDSLKARALDFMVMESKIRALLLPAGSQS